MQRYRQTHTRACIYPWCPVMPQGLEATAQHRACEQAQLQSHATNSAAAAHLKPTPVTKGAQRLHAHTSVASITHTAASALTNPAHLHTRPWSSSDTATPPQATKIAHATAHQHQQRQPPTLTTGTAKHAAARHQQRRTRQSQSASPRMWGCACGRVVSCRLSLATRRVPWLGSNSRVLFSHTMLSRVNSKQHRHTLHTHAHADSTPRQGRGQHAIKLCHQPPLLVSLQKTQTKTSHKRCGEQQQQQQKPAAAAAVNVERCPDRLWQQAAHAAGDGVGWCVVGGRKGRRGGNFCWARPVAAAAVWAVCPPVCLFGHLTVLSCRRAHLVASCPHRCAFPPHKLQMQNPCSQPPPQNLTHSSTPAEVQDPHTNSRVDRFPQGSGRAKPLPACPSLRVVHSRAGRAVNRAELECTQMTADTRKGRGER